MIKRFLSIMVVVAIVLSLFAVNFTASALVNTKILYGDMNGDKVVDTSDASTVLKVAAGLATVTDTSAKKRCDINGDGVITLYDARQILRNCANIVEIQPTGAFTGFSGGDVFATEAEALKYFNTNLNKIKSSKAGFIRSEKEAVTSFSIDDVSISGLALGTTAKDVSKAIEESLVAETQPEQTQISIKGENCDNAMSVETATYVSNLKNSEVLGIKCAKSTKAGTITIKVALPDGDIENISQSAINDALNVKLIQEKSSSTIGNVFGEDGDTATNSIKNCVLTAVFSAKTGRVISYETSYETNLYIAKSTMGISGGRITAHIQGVRYSTSSTVIYSDFEW